MSTICKEQSNTRKCIVTEKIIDCGDKCDDNKKEKDCSEKYKQLGDCLNECLMQKCRERKNKALKKSDDFDC